MEDIREIIGTSPRRCILDVVVTGHVFGENGDAVGGIFRQEICGGEARHTGPEISKLAYLGIL